MLDNDKNTLSVKLKFKDCIQQYIYKIKCFNFMDSRHSNSVLFIFEKKKK